MLTQQYSCSYKDPKYGEFLSFLWVKMGIISQQILSKMQWIHIQKKKSKI
jgi:hypothetical protein